MIVNKSYAFWNVPPACAGGLRYLISAESRSPAAITAPTIAHLKTNFSLFNPLYNGFFARCYPFAPAAAILPT